MTDAGDAAAALPAVAASEAVLIALARALVAPDGADVWPLLAGSRTLPDAISPACAELLGDALRHAWPALWRRGAVPGARPWRAAAAPIGLAFGAPTLELVRWLVATPLGAPSAARPTLRARGELTVGDQVAVYLALARADRTLARAAIAAQPLVRAAPLAWLGFADALASGGARDAPPQRAFDALATCAGAIAVAALAAELARRWTAVELAKRTWAHPDELVALGAAQDATLSAWLAACDRARRRDLAAFVLGAAAPVVASGISPAPVALDRRATLAVRAAARLASGALLRAVARCSAWDDEHRGVRFIDDDYAEAQRLLAQFEVLGPAGAARCAAWLADLGALSA